MSSIHWPFLWALLFFAIVAFECLALGSGHSEYTLSYTVWMIRHDPIGRFVVLPLMFWLLVHFTLSPKWLLTHFDWRNVVGMTVGFAIALFETLKAHR